MTDQEINIAIAEAVGEVCPHCGSPSLDKKECGSISGMWHAVTTKDYCNDLNAMSEVEASIYGDLHFLYVEKLVSVTQCDPEVVGDEWCLIHASARQRAEAFLRTLGRWVDKDQTKVKLSLHAKPANSRPNELNGEPTGARGVKQNKNSKTKTCTTETEEKQRTGTRL